MLFPRPLEDQTARATRQPVAGQKMTGAHLGLQAVIHFQGRWNPDRLKPST